MNEILTETERAAIRALAAGDKEQLGSATAAFHRSALKYGIDACIELKFMAEVLAPVPDLLLRSHYRKSVLKQSR